MEYNKPKAFDGHHSLSTYIWCFPQNSITELFKRKCDFLFSFFFCYKDNIRNYSIYTYTGLCIGLCYSWVWPCLSMCSVCPCVYNPIYNYRKIIYLIIVILELTAKITSQTLKNKQNPYIAILCAISRLWMDILGRPCLPNLQQLLEVNIVVNEE